MHLEFRGKTPICLNKHRSITAGNQFAPISSLLWHLYCSPPFPPSCCFPSSPPSSSSPPPRRHHRARGPVIEILHCDYIGYKELLIIIGYKIILVIRLSIVIKIIIAIIMIDTQTGESFIAANKYNTTQIE